MNYDLVPTTVFTPMEYGCIGRVVQVDPIKPTLKAPGIKLLKLKFDELHSRFAFKSNLRCYTSA
jgi:hypothetical protein